jgi:hypothetical protein
MDPITLAIGLALAGGGAYLSGQNQSDQASAANAILGSKIGTLNRLGDTNQATLKSDLSGYTPAAQDAQLTQAQNDRSNTSVGNISDPTAAGINDIPVGDAPRAVKGEIAKRMLATHDAAVDRAKAMGKLGGYGDTWLSNNLRNAEAGRNIGYNDMLANEQKALIQPEQQLAMAKTYSPLGTYLTGAGNLMGSAAGGGGIFGGSGAPYGTVGYGSGSSMYPGPVPQSLFG